MEIDLLKPSLFPLDGIVKCNCSPCYNCLFRKMLAVAFDRHVWGKDCPKCGEPDVCCVKIDDV